MGALVTRWRIVQTGSDSGASEAIEETNPRRDGGIELQQDDESDTHVGVDGAQQEAERVKRLVNDDPALARGQDFGHFGRGGGLHQARTLRIAQAGEEHSAEQKKV